MSLSQFVVSYVTLVTHNTKSLELLQPEYEMIPITVTYNLASIVKMGYKDTDNNGIFVKVCGAQDEDDEGEDGEPAQNSAAPTLGQIMDVLGEIQLNLGHFNLRFNSMDERLDSLSAQVVAIDHKVSVGANMEELHGDPAQSQSSEATQSPPYA